MARFTVEALIHYVQGVELEVEAESAEEARKRVESTSMALDQLNGPTIFTVDASDEEWRRDEILSVTPAYAPEIEDVELPEDDRPVPLDGRPAPDFPA